MAERRTKEERVASINARQSITVAVIAAGAAIAGAFIQASTNSSKVQHVSQRWLTVTGARPLNEELENASVRLIAIVTTDETSRAIKFSYPPGVLWSQVGSNIAGGSYPLPVGAKEYNVMFEGYYKSGDSISTFKLANQNGQPIAMAGSGTTGDQLYKLYLVDPSQTHLKDPVLDVIFRVE